MLRKRDEMILKREKEGIEMEKRRIIEKVRSAQKKPFKYLYLMTQFDNVYFLI